MKRLLKYLFIVFGLGLVFSVNSWAGEPLSIKKLVSFVLNNAITIDYDGKKESYIFKKVQRPCQFTSGSSCWKFVYEVREGTKMVGKGTWVFHMMDDRKKKDSAYYEEEDRISIFNIKLRRDSIKLSGYRNFYLQVYKKQDVVSTYAWVPGDYEDRKKIYKKDEQINREIVDIAPLKDFEPAQLAQKKIEDKILLAPGMKVYFYFVGEQNRAKKRLISIRYKKLKGKENFENWKLSDNPDLIRVPKELYSKLKSAVDFDTDTPINRKKAHKIRKKLLYSFYGEKFDWSKYDGVYILKINTCNNSGSAADNKRKLRKYWNFGKNDHMDSIYITIQDGKITERMKGWQYKIIIQPERNDTKININIKGKKGLWDGSIVEDKIFLKFKGKNDKEHNIYGDCELLFANQFWTANETDTAKLDNKKDKIFEKIVSEYAKHTKQENKVNILIAELSNTQKKAEEKKWTGKPFSRKKLVSFVLNNVITIDYDGKKESYIFKKVEIPCEVKDGCWKFIYEVQEGIKLVGKGMWVFLKKSDKYEEDLSKSANQYTYYNKKLSKNSIKLFGYRNMYLQVYKKQDRVSTYAFVPSNYEAKKDKKDDQINREIVDIAPTKDFEKRIAKEKKLEEERRIAEVERKKQEKILAEKRKEEEKRKKELLLAQKEEDEKKKQELLLAQKKAEEEKRLAEEKRIAAAKKEEEKRLAEEKKKLAEKPKEEFKPEDEELDNDAPIIEIAETITVKDNSYEIEGKVTDKSDKIFIKIAGKIIKVENGKFIIKRFSPVDEAVKIVAIDQWGNESQPKIINIIVDIEDSEIAEILEPLDPSKIESQSSNSKVALIIGIEQYDQSPNASFANLDAKYFFDYARRGFGIKKQNIKMLVDEEASLSKTYTAIFKWLPGKIKSNETDLIIFFSGHGLASSDGKAKYILPSNADPDLLSKTALSRSELFDQIIKLNPKSVTMFFDTCYSGVSRDEETLLASAKPLRIVAEESNEIPDNFTIFTASKAEQISSGLKEAKHGIFSYYLMKGLEGKADTNKDKDITNGELLAYMDQNVSERALDLGRQQNPSLVGDPDKILMSY